MVFSSLIFLFFFFPAFILGYCTIGKRFRNFFLLCASLFFYAWGEGIYTGVMLISIGVNWGIGIGIDRFRERLLGRIAMITGVLFNLLLLIAFKYWEFILETLSHCLLGLGYSGIDIPQVHLPIGISFFTFQALTYTIDIYNNKASVQRNPFNVGLYIALFPQLIAGPIVRYSQIAEFIKSRSVSVSDITAGIERFVFGLGKKVLIANNVALVTDKIFGLPLNTLPAGIAWAGILGYTVQIYYDFSGYSDMAIGIGRMIGFRFPENFRTPYGSLSMREFWQRWHITLSTWFRDYLYIPLGGNRKGSARTCFNLFTVFFLCGLWHGASWNFIVWGGWHGLFLSLERSRLSQGSYTVPTFLRHAYVLLVVVVGWVFFRTQTVGESFLFLKAMAGASSQPYSGYQEVFSNSVFIICLLFGFAFSFSATVKAIEKALTSKPLEGILFYCILFLSIISLISGSYNPFIYFRF